MMKPNEKSKFAEFIGFLAMCISLIASCIPQNARPLPTLDPIYLTSEAQTIKTRVKYLNDITAEDPDRDYEITNNKTKPHWTRIENDWISFYQETDYANKEKILIIIQENNTRKERQYTLKLIGYVFDGTLTVIQEANN